jgi:hypothetical protein
MHPFKERMTDKEYISYLQFENNLLKHKLLEVGEDVKKAYNKGLEQGYNEALKEFSKHD